MDKIVYKLDIYIFNIPENEAGCRSGSVLVQVAIQLSCEIPHGISSIYKTEPYLQLYLCCICQNKPLLKTGPTNLPFRTKTSYSVLRRSGFGCFGSGLKAPVLRLANISD